MSPFEDPPSSSIDLGGSLLLADPSLRDPNFFRTVLLLTSHDTAEGAHGFVLNRPLDKAVGEILPEGDFEDLSGIPVFIGGPVNTEQLTFASLAWKDDDSLGCDTHLSAEQARCRLAEGFLLRAFVGYSGWSGGQLESELRQRAWIPRNPDRLILNSADSPRMWSDLLRTMGPWYRLLADTPDDPSLN